MNSLRFSIIIVAYNIENFIEQAMLSCVFPGRDDYEVIVVENHSTDDTLNLAKRVAAEHAGLFKIVECEKNHGLGIGRNIGVDNSTSDYILFLDGDDWFAEATLDRLAPLALTHESDVFVFNHARAFDNGKISINTQSKRLAEGPRDATEHRRSLLRNFGVAWNKMYKRSFVLANSLRFGAGFYEDIDWNFKALLLAERVYAIPDVLVYYRQRTGSITRSTDIRHFDILSQYRKVIDFLTTRPDLVEAYGSAVYIYGRDQMVNVLNDRNRLPDKERARFLRELSAVLAGFSRLVRRTRVTWKEAAIARRNIFLYDLTISALRIYTSIEKEIRKRYGPRLGKLQRELTKRSRLRDYRKQVTQLPLRDDLVFLEAFWGQKIDCNPLAIARSLEHNGFKCVWSVQKNFTKPPHYNATTVIKGSEEYYRTLAQAKYLVSNANIADEWIKRDGQIHVNTFHGTPLKLMGLDIIKTNPKEMDWNAYAVRSKRWDFILSSNRHSTRAWRRNSPYGYKALETGYPRNDILFSTDQSLIERIRGDLGIPNGKKVVLYAPTFREADKGKATNVSATEYFDAESVQRAFGDDFVLLTRGHYFLKPSGGRENPLVRDVSDYAVTNEICLISDVLISDYSSIMFDYACLNRPIILYPYDFEDYAATRGMYFDVREDAPGMVAFEFSELIAGIEAKRFSSDDNQQRLLKFNEEFCSFDDGRATERVMSQVFGKVGMPEQM